LAIHGGLLGGILGGSIYLYRKRLPFWTMADLCVPSIILGQSIGRWGNFFNQEAYGSQVSAQFISHFPDFIQQQMWIKGAYYHPTFLYESLWCFLGFLVLQFLWTKRKFDGQILALYLIFYSTGRIFIEQLRTDSLMLGTLKMAQVISLILILSGILIYVFRCRHPLWPLKTGKGRKYV
ncbi:MAG: prolipoprotein diacylglyceryl transferase, partial [Clostridia bacterium]|nr:prolipoprotein diacylglyceryl transferase [Clostridia bacterium]